jgi:hypothetical protein
LFEEEKHCIEKYQSMSKNKIKIIIKQLHNSKESYIKYLEENIKNTKTNQINFIDKSLFLSPFNFKNSIKIEASSNRSESQVNNYEKSAHPKSFSNLDFTHPKIKNDFSIPNSVVPSFRSRNEFSNRRQNTIFQLKDSEIENLQIIKLHKSISRLQSIDKKINITTRFTRYDDEKVLSLPKISFLCLNDTNNNKKEKSSIFDKIESLRSVEKINYENFDMNEKINIPYSKIKQLKNLKMNTKINMKIIKKNQINETSNHKFNLPSVANKDGNFKHLFVLKENKKVKKL